MDKKKTKLTISGSSTKTISNIELAKSKGKNSVIIEKKLVRFENKPRFLKTDKQETSFKSKPFITSKEPISSKSSSTPSSTPSTHFEKRKLAEQRGIIVPSNLKKK